MEVGLVQKIDIDDEMQQAYLDYAMSVIVARALPDARDGLKPVHRRILYSMYDMGLRPESAYKKSARIVGEVLGKYHPHGDMAVYDAMARMAQSFSMRYLLVDGQGNFGSVDGDPPAAMRYTEARLATPAGTMLTDIGKETVDFTDNFDGTLTEPSVLPAAIPNLLVNGATGIAVGMATSIPPHNLGEVVDALRFLLEHWDKMDDISLDDLMNFIQGPDFPTGGVIIHDSNLDDEGLKSSYGSGRGRVTVQARAHLEEMERGKTRIIVTELPYMTNKASLIERIAELVRMEKIEGIADLRDESDRQGMRIVIELTKSVEPEAVLRDLYKHTPMQNTFSIILLALVDGEPRLLTLRGALRVYLEHRLEIIRRRSEYDLAKAQQRAHILEGYRIALANLDAVIALIRKSPDVETARTRLMRQFKLSEIQAQAILDMPLRRLAALERKKIEDEYKEIQGLIKGLETLLRSPKKMRQVVNDELLAVKEAYNDRRRTQIISVKEGEKKTSILTAHDLLPEKQVWVSVTAEGYISRSLEDKQPRLSGKSAPVQLLQVNTRDTLFLINENGDGAAIALHALPETDDTSQGVPFWSICPLGDGSNLVGIFSLPPKERPENRYILTVSVQGMVKKSPLSELPGPSASSFILTKINEDDKLWSTHLTQGEDELLLVTTDGMAIRFSESEVRPMGLVAAGVMGIKLRPGSTISGSEILPKTGDVFLMTTNGYAKRVRLKDFPKQGRYGQGVLAWRPNQQTDLIGLAIGKGTERVIVHLNRLASKSIRLDEAPLQTRAARGKEILELRGDDFVSGLTMPQGISKRMNQDEAGETQQKTRSPRPKSNSAAKTAPTAVKRAAAKTTRAKSVTSSTSSTPRQTTKKTTSKPTDLDDGKTPSSRKTTTKSKSGTDSQSKRTATSSKSGTKTTSSSNQGTNQPTSTRTTSKKASTSTSKPVKKSSTSPNAQDTQPKSSRRKTTTSGSG